MASFDKERNTSCSGLISCMEEPPLWACSWAALWQGRSFGSEPNVERSHQPL